MDIKTPQHINATPQDLRGNQGIGRYLFLTGSDNRAKEISEHFDDKIVLPHGRQHNLYLGSITHQNDKIDVGAISTGMGGPSADIIINELIMMGARRFLRIGTAGSLQPDRIKVGSIVIATGAVRDDKASWDYIYREYPALASLEYLIAAGRANNHQPSAEIHFGIVHSKSSLYAREFHLSLMPENDNYMTTMRHAGVIASEMECAQLFTLSSLMSHKLMPERILCGGILAIVGDHTSFSNEKEQVDAVISKTIRLGLDLTHEIYLIDQKKKDIF